MVILSQKLITRISDPFLIMLTYYGSNIVVMFLFRETKSYDGSDLYPKVTKLINRYGETLDNEDHGRNLLHKLILENRLFIRQVP